MKTYLALATAALFAGTAFAQNTTDTTSASSSGQKHMVEFNADSVLLATYAFNKSKNRGQSADNDSQVTFSGGYAYQLPNMPRIQVGGRLLYTKATEAADRENYGAQVGAIYNHIDNLQDSAYASLYVGMQWNNTYGSNSSSDENLLSTLAIGKRFNLSHWGIDHLTYTPEIALVNQNSTTESEIEYSQSVQLRVLQFSVFF